MPKNPVSETETPTRPTETPAAPILPRAVLPVGKAAKPTTTEEPTIYTPTRDGLMAETTFKTEGAVRILAPDSIAQRAKAAGWLAGTFTDSAGEAQRAKPGSYFVVTIDGVCLLARAREVKSEGVKSVGPGAIVGYLGWANPSAAPKNG